MLSWAKGEPRWLASWGQPAIRGWFAIRALFEEERGQDLIEYSLLMAFIALAGAAMFVSMGLTTSGIWSIVNSRLAASNQS